MHEYQTRMVYHLMVKCISVPPYLTSTRGEKDQRERDHSFLCGMFVSMISFAFKDRTTSNACKKFEAYKSKSKLIRLKRF